MLWTILVIVAVLVAIPMLLAVVGMMLPQQHVASRSAPFAGKSPQEVFATIASWRDFPSWRSGMKSVEERAGEGGRVSWVESGPHGLIPLEVVENDSPRRLVTRIADPKLPFGGTWTWQIEAEGNGCRVTITEDGEIYNPIFRCLARFVFGYTSTMDTYLKDLGRRFGQETEVR